ncbi:MAG: putative porin [Verrucomicrobiota bacterium]
MKKGIAKLLGVTALMTMLSATARAQSSDALLDKLVEKGILTVGEANGLRVEADKGFNQAYSVKSGMPEWVNSLKFNGDVRVRYDGLYLDAPGTVDRNRFRFRLRFGVTAMLTDNIEVGLRLISSENGKGGFTSGDPISGNSSFDDNGSKKFIGIDLAYAKWSPINTPQWSGTITAGKMENPFVFSDMIFDSDYTPEGLAEQFAYAFHEHHSLKFNFGEFLLDEVSTNSHDPFLLGGQVRLDSVWNPKWQSSFGLSALTISGTENLGSTKVPDQNRGNTRIGGALQNKFNPIIVDGAVTYTLDKFPMYSGAFPIRLAADYANNPAARANNQAYSAGVTFGKSGKRGTWDLTYKYKYLESDYWFEELVDSDTGAFYQVATQQSNGGTGYASGTNLRGHYFRAAFSPYDSVTLSATYFLFDLIRGRTSHSEAGRLQVDASVKF